MYKVILDAGHGGKDPGAVGNGLQEKEITLKIVGLIKDLLEKSYDGVEVKRTRQDDTFISLPQRSTYANREKADLFVSVHIDAASNARAEGMTTYSYVEASAASRALQNVLHTEIVKACPFFKDRGQLKADFSVVRETKGPAVLTENGFITNVGDTNKLKNSGNLAAIAAGHVNGIAKYLGLKPKQGASMEDFKGHWAEEAIRGLMARGIMGGYSDGSFKPDQPPTRAEMASVIYRMILKEEAKK